jgi:ABC-type sugar transport system permease subunit
MDRPYPDDSYENPWKQGKTRESKKPISLSKLQIAAILLVIVFIWGIISAVSIAMFDIHLLALTEFEDDGRADVSGFITDSEGISLHNVTVIIHGTQHFTKTNYEGFYTMENIKEGDYEIEASKDGFGGVTKRVALNANSPTLVNFILEEGGFDKTENERFGSSLSDLEHLNYATAIFIVIYSSFALVGGIATYFQRMYWIAMFGALCGVISGILSIGIVIAPILSIIALFIIVTNKDDFITSERPLLDRLLGVQRAESTPAGPSRARKQISKEPTPPPLPLKSKASKAEPFEPDPMGYKATMTCIACGGSVKSESQAIICIQCGACYHGFCASSIMVCRQCDTPL